MTGWTAKRFWDAAHVVEIEGGHTVHLDARPVRTPGKLPLIVPTKEMAHAIAAEWDAQDGVINPLSMPVTRAANSAIEKVTPQRAAVVAELAGYGGSDLICYRAVSPEGLIAKQAAAWDPWLAWVANAFDAPLIQGQGVMPIAQPPESLARLHARVDMFDAFQLAGFHDLVAISGSLVLALAVTQGKLDPHEAWTLSRIDEDWQIAEWGADEEAAEQAELKQLAFIAAASFMKLSQMG